MSGSRSSLLWSWIGVFVVAGSALLYGVVDEGTPRTNADRAYALAQDFACPVCQGQSVAESDVPVARNIRREIATWVSEGRTDAEIRDELVAAFGEDIDYNPPATGVSALVWVLPVVVGAGAVVGLVVAFRRNRLVGQAEIDPDDEVLVAAARRSADP